MRVGTSRLIGAGSCVLPLLSWPEVATVQQAVGYGPSERLLAATRAAHISEPSRSVIPYNALRLAVQRMEVLNPQSHWTAVRQIPLYLDLTPWEFAVIAAVVRASDPATLWEEISGSMPGMLCQTFEGYLEEHRRLVARLREIETAIIMAMG